ncbi:MAG: MurR/RpiR family transcriptional regulator [Deltaproteobacteria bacterium]|jgi:DNA-binding MurR/RpiR family transcriptional regulator|nr:MurR/RpiR family transcriptional regulator [Deltaproteobacteria bacterium]
MFEERLRVRFQYLTKTQKQIAEFLLNNAEEAAFQSISGLAEALNTSTSNIFRLAKAIGYSGYPELQSDLQKKIRQKISPVKALENSREKDKGKDIYSIIFDMDAKNLASTQELNSKETIDRAVKEIIAARRIGFVGFRSSQSIAFLLSFFLGRVRKNCELLDNWFGNLTNYLVNYGPKDLMVGISFPRYSRQTLEVLKYGKQAGCKVISLTDNPVSPVGQISDLVLLAGHKTSTYFNSFSSAVTLVNCLVAGVSLKNKKSLEVLKSFDHIDNDWQYFLR